MLVKLQTETYILDVDPLHLNPLGYIFVLDVRTNFFPDCTEKFLQNVPPVACFILDVYAKRMSLCNSQRLFCSLVTAAVFVLIPRVPTFLHAGRPLNSPILTTLYVVSHIGGL
jgi:hypothetical protein